MLTCKLCLNITPTLAESHVYPKALHRLFADPEVPAFTINRNPAHPAQTTQRSLGGLYGEFVCPTCERELFGPADNEFMALHHRLGSWPLPPEPIRGALHLVPGNPDLIHRFALQTFWRWAVCPGGGVEHIDYGPMVDRFREFLLDPTGTLRTGRDVTVSYRIAADNGLALPPEGGRAAGHVFMTIGRFTFFIASRHRPLPPPMGEHSLRKEDGVRLVATTEMHAWLTGPVADMLGEGRGEHVDQFIERMRGISKRP